MRSWPGCVVFTVLLGVGFAGCVPAFVTGSPRRQNDKVSLVFQAHFRGQLLPRCLCGCQSGSWGGVARRAAYVDSLRSKRIPLLLMDAGNFFAEDDPSTDIISVVAWKEMERLGYDAVTLGRRELENWALVKYLLSESPIPLVTTNLQQQEGAEWKPVGATHLIVERGDLRVGILGLTAESDVPEWVFRSAKDSLRLLPTVAAARQTCEQLGCHVDLVVALVASHSHAFDSLSCVVPEIDVVVAGRGVCSIKGTVTNRPGGWGRSLEITSLVISPAAELVSYGSRSVALTDSIPEDPVLAADARWVVEQSRQVREEIRQKREKIRQMRSLNRRGKLKKR